MPEPPDGLADDAEEILWRPREIYRPFTADEVEILRTFSTNVHELRTYSFFQQVPSQFQMVGTRIGQPIESRMRDPPREATRAAVSLFRHLYGQNEDANFTKVMKILKRSVHERDSEHREAALAILDLIYRGQQVLLDEGAGIGMYYAAGGKRSRLTTEDVLATYLHGVWVHSDSDKSRRAAALDRAPPFAPFTFYTAIAKLTLLYIDAAVIADVALAEPSLLPAD
jgi:hypothetical protein